MNEQNDGPTPEEQLLAALNSETIPSTRRSLAPEPVCWRYLNLSEESIELEVLAGWVRWFVRRYCLDYRTVPPCWAKHGALVEELSALRTLWEVCYNDDAAPADPHTFHHSLSLALGRLEAWAKRRQCNPTEHRPDLPPRWLIPGD